MKKNGTVFDVDSEFFKRAEQIKGGKIDSPKDFIDAFDIQEGDVMQRKFFAQDVQVNVQIRERFTI